MDMTVDQQAAKLLQQAQLLMNDGGTHWGKGSFRHRRYTDGVTQYCAVGAIREVLRPGSSGIPLTNPAFMRAIHSLARTINPDVPPRDDGDALNRIYDWNDSQKRTWEHVSKMFTRAIGRINRGK